MCSVLYCERRVVGIETGYKKEPDVQHLQSLKFLVSCCCWLSAGACSAELSQRSAVIKCFKYFAVVLFSKI